jgi:Domain of unknown function (DUF4276)
VIIPIVEGQSEVASVPLLFRRILFRAEIYDVEIAPPFRVKRNLVVRQAEVERAVRQAMRSRHGGRAIALLLDSDDDCPVNVASELLQRARTETTYPVAVIMAKREFEAWFLGAKESLRGTRGIRDDAVAPNAPEEIRGAKERLSQNMSDARTYVEVDDQPALVERFDIDAALATCRSFRKCVEEVERLGRLLSRPPKPD